MKLHVGMHSTHARVLFCVGAAQARNASAEGTPPPSTTISDSTHRPPLLFLHLRVNIGNNASMVHDTAACFAALMLALIHCVQVGQSGY
jgi:hypothetical protein